MIRMWEGLLVRMDKYRLLITNEHMKTLLIILKAEYFLY